MDKLTEFMLGKEVIEAVKGMKYEELVYCNKKLKQENRSLLRLIESMETDLKQKFDEYIKNIDVLGKKPKVTITSNYKDIPMTIQKRIFIPNFQMFYYDVDDVLEKKKI